MATGGPWDSDPNWFAKNGYAWSDTTGWYLPDTTAGGFHAMIDPRDSTIATLREALKAARAGLDKFARVANINDALPPHLVPPDDVGARDCLPGVWPTMGDLRRARAAIAQIDATLRNRDESDKGNESPKG